MGGNSVQVQIGANIEGLIAGVEGVKGQLEGLAEFTEGLQATFTGLGEAIAAVFAVEQLESFIEHISDLGSKVETASAQMGISTEKVFGLKYAADLADVSLDQATRTVEHFFMSLQVAQSGTGRQAAAFNALGISTDMLRDKNIDLNATYDIAIGKLGQMADSQRKTDIIMDIFGNRSAQTVRLINVLSDGMGDLTTKTQALGAPSEAYLKQLQEIHVRVTDLSTVFEYFKMKLSDIALFFVKAAEGAVEFVSIVKAAFEGLAQIFNMGMAEASDFTEGFYKIMTTPPGKGYFDRVSEEWHKTVENIKKDAADGTKGINDLITKEKTLIDTLEHPTLTDAGIKKSGENAPAIINPATIKKDMQVWEDALNEMLLQKQEFGQAALQDELQFWQQKLLIVKKGSDDYYAIEKKIYEAEKQLNTQRLREADKDERQQEQIYTRFFNSFNSGLISMMKGTGTWRDFMRSAFFNVVENGLKMMEKLVAHWLASENAKTAATIAGNTARSGSDATAAAASSKGFGSAAMAQIQGDAAKAYGGVYGFLAPEIGPFAAIPAAAAYVAVIGMEALVPSFDVGSWNVPFDTLAMVHENERILTASENLYGTGKDSGGGMSVHFHGGINDAGSIRALFMQEGPTLKRSIEKQAGLSHQKVKK